MRTGLLRDSCRFNAFIGNAQLKHINEANQKRSDNFLKIANVVYKNTDKYYPIKFDHIDFLSNMAIPIVCRSTKIHNNLIKKCDGLVEIRPIVGGNITQQPFFRKYLPDHAENFKNTNAELIHKQGFYVGNNPDYNKKDINTIISALS